MFRLQRLEITGFKSFADYTEIIFTGSGITAVVGPNGCGKSNVSESIAWVLGEQRAKALRGSEMQDVIFQGTNKRPPSGMAEVVLHLVRDEETFFEDDESELSDIDEAIGELDERAVNIEDFTAEKETVAANGHASQEVSINGNSPQENSENGSQNEKIQAETAEVAASGASSAPLAVQPKAKPKRHWRPRRLALDFAPGESVSVTRRLYRSGESEYLLNGKPCRLRDIQDLFAGTGLSGAHYAIIEQGRIGQILSAKPSDRRTLIEEAAGISKFRTRQRAAEARLETAKTNLRRISDIVEEVEKQANSLRRQAAKTRRYKVLREEFRELLRQTFSAEGSYLTELVNELEKRLEEAVAVERKLFAEVAAKDEAFRAATQAAREAEEFLSELRARHSENALQRDRAARDLQYKKEQIGSLQTRVEVLKGEAENVRERLKLVKAEAERLTQEERRERAENERQELALREAENKYREKINEMRRLEAELEKVRNEVFQHTTAVERLAEIRRQHENTIERLLERVEGLRRESARTEESFQEHLAESQKLEKELAVARENLRKLQDERRVLTEAANEARQHLRAAEKELAGIREQFSRTRHRLESLQELDARRAVYAPTVQKLFAEQKKIGVNFLGTLADKLRVAPEAERAVENVFGAFLQTVIVESAEDARKVLDYLNANKLGRLSVLVFNEKQKTDKSNKKDQNAKKNLLNLLGASEDFAEILEELFPRETSAELVENLDEIKAAAGEIFVSQEGEMSVAGKLFIGGRANANEKNSSLLAFKRELRELEAKREELAAEMEKAEKAVKKSRAQLTEKENKIAELQSYITKSEREILAQEIQAKTLAQETERAERHKRVVAEEIKQIEKEISDIRARTEEARAGSEKAEKARLAASENLEKAMKRLAEAREKIELENAELNEKRTSAGVAAERRRSVAASLRRVENEASELESRLSRLELEKVENEAKLKDLTEEISKLTQTVESAKDAEEAENQEIIEATEKLKQARESADAMSAELAELNKKSAEARNARAELEVRQAESVTRLQNLNESCTHELGQSLVEIVETVETPEGFDLEAAHKQTEELRRRIESFGAVNMLALEELSETEERLSFLTSQHQDIIDGIHAAEEALKEIKQRSRERFRHAFEAINEYFREFFVELFGGGRGEMTLIEAEDILESGIEIVAQPPGKRLQNILLLSGGEKAMTAIALVMAIFKYRPSPFCLLDEVDAPLDDANVGRFVDKIASMSEKTQFIVITHNKRTMEAARALYGVTMQEAGVSKVVSVKFE